MTFSQDDIDPRPEPIRRLEHLVRYLAGALGHTRHWCAYSSLHSIDDFGRCHAPGLLALCRRLGFPRPDVVLSSVPPGGAILLGARLSSALGCRWVVDFRDLQALRDDRHPLLCFIDRLWERFLLRKVDGLIGVSPTSTRLLSSAYPKPAATVFNGFETPLETKPSGGSRGEYLYYAGTLYHHQMNALELLIRSIAEVRDLGLKLTMLFRILPGPRELERRLRETIADHNLQEQSVLGEPVPPSRCQSEAKAASANIILEDLSTRTAYSRGTIPGKMMELINYTPPVLAIARPDSDMAVVLSESGSGRLASTQKELTGLLTEVPRQEKNLQPYCREEQGRKLAEFLDRLP